MRKIKVVLVAIALIFVIVLIGLTSTKKEVNEVCDQVVIEVEQTNNESVKEESDNVVLLEKEVIEDENPEYYLRLSTTSSKHAKEINL